MPETDIVFAGSIPENYDRYLVPLIFESFAHDIAQRVATLSPSTVLETAAGSGVVTRALTPRLTPDASYVVTDLNQPMLDYAATRQPADNRISWRKADALALPFDTVRELPYATRSKPGTQASWRSQPTTRHPRLRIDMEAARLLQKFRLT